MFFLQPPQYDLYELIIPPDSFISSNACIANIWSIPGSTPTSFTIVIPALTALYK